MSTFKEEIEERLLQKSDSYDNSITLKKENLPKIMDIPFQVGEKVCWVIMSEEYYLGDYSERCTLYGVNKYGHWAAVYDSHCSCNGWEATESDITYYASLEDLLKADKEAIVVLKYCNEIEKIYPFINIDREIIKKVLSDQQEQINTLTQGLKGAKIELLRAFGDLSKECFEALPQTAELLGINEKNNYRTKVPI